MCNHTKIVCPFHDGSFDCTPFCATCEGEQEYCPTCDPDVSRIWDAAHSRAIDMVLDVCSDMYNSGNFHNPTLDELEQRIV